MKILYGVQGTGNGHLSRTRALLPALQRPGVEIDFVFSGRKREDFFDMDSFGKFMLFEGLTLIFNRGRLQIFQTLCKNKILQLIRDIRNLDLADYDLVISDFEPISAWAAKLQGVPCISLSHQCAFYQDVPKIKGHWASKLLMQKFAPSETAVGFHYHHFNQPVLPPLIGSPTFGKTVNNKIVVYMGFEALDDIIDFVQPFTDYEFQIFAKVQQTQDLGHITINPVSYTVFHQQLKTCSGVISNAGFELSSETLSYGKKLLIKPLAGQYEQLCNVLALEKMGRATAMDSLDQNILGQWLEQQSEPPINYPPVAQPLAAWILDKDRPSLEYLAKNIWAAS